MVLEDVFWGGGGGAAGRRIHGMLVGSVFGANICRSHFLVVAY